MTETPKAPDKRKIVIWMRMWIERTPLEPAHYGERRVEVEYPGGYSVNYEPTQHTVILRKPGGDVAGAYRDVRRMTTDAVSETWD